jgi:hypothetical protein
MNKVYKGIQETCIIRKMVCMDALVAPLFYYSR